MKASKKTIHITAKLIERTKYGPQNDFAEGDWCPMTLALHEAGFGNVFLITEDPWNLWYDTANGTDCHRLTKSQIKFTKDYLAGRGPLKPFTFKVRP